MKNMFSKTELEFIKGELQVSNSYARVLRYRINKKVESLREVLPHLIKNGYLIFCVTENSNDVTEFSNNYPNQENPNSGFFSENNRC